jgi:polar amino acid transport system substrate-binding protein
MAVTMTDPLIQRSTGNVRIDYAPALPLTTGNAQQLEQVVINLITNACQSLADTSGEIRIKTYSSRETGEVGVIVKDSGSGIKEADLKHIMDPFFTTKRDKGGTGLGLSVSYNIVKSHGGSLVLTSEPNRGTKAKVALPVVASPVAMREQVSR